MLTNLILSGNNEKARAAIVERLDEMAIALIEKAKVAVAKKIWAPKDKPDDAYADGGYSVKGENDKKHKPYTKWDENK